MIITTTMHIENKPVQEYKGIVFGEVEYYSIFSIDLWLAHGDSSLLQDSNG